MTRLFPTLLALLSLVAAAQPLLCHSCQAWYGENLEVDSYTDYLTGDDLDECQQKECTAECVTITFTL